MEHNMTPDFYSTTCPALLTKPSPWRVVIYFEDEWVKVSKRLLTSVSPVFAAAFNGNFCNATTNEYTIEGYSKDAIHAMIDHIHGPEFEFEKDFTSYTTNAHTYSHMIDNLDYYFDVYMIANEYEVESLTHRTAEVISQLVQLAVRFEDPEGLAILLKHVMQLYDMNNIPDMYLAWQTASSVCYVYAEWFRAHEDVLAAMKETANGWWEWYDQPCHLWYQWCNDPRTSVLPW